MADPISPNLPPSVQAVNKARSNAQTQSNQGSVTPTDEVSLSQEAQEIGDVNRIAGEARNQLSEDLNQTLSRGDLLNQLS